MLSHRVLLKVDGSLYRLAFERLQACKPSSNGILRFPIVFQRLGSTFSLPKEEVWKLLFVLREMGLIEVVAYHGVRINGKRKGVKENGKR